MPTLSKVFEKLIKARLVKHLTYNKIISLRQFGYQIGLGTTEAIDTLVDDIVSKLNNKMRVCGLFLDVSSVFETVNHDILLGKLDHYGLRGDDLKLIVLFTWEKTVCRTKNK